MRVKAWERSKRNGRLSRRQNVRDERPRILIVCEGKKTEPAYLKGFRIPSVNLEIVPAAAVHITVVNRALRILQEDSDYEQIWCVFDRDKHPGNPNDVNQFNAALRLAANNSIRVAYSNDAFELWYLLHFGYYDMRLTRADYMTKLQTLVPGGYKKNDPEMFRKIEDRMDDAIRNAKRLYETGDNTDPANHDPSTTVYQLVEELRRYI